MHRTLYVPFFFKHFWPTGCGKKLNEALDWAQRQSCNFLIIYQISSKNRQQLSRRPKQITFSFIHSHTRTHFHFHSRFSSCIFNFQVNIKTKTFRRWVTLRSLTKIGSVGLVDRSVARIVIVQAVDPIFRPSGARFVSPCQAVNQKASINAPHVAPPLGARRRRNFSARRSWVPLWLAYCCSALRINHILLFYGICIFNLCFFLKMQIQQKSHIV